MKFTTHEAAKVIITHYGAQHQLVKLCEECAELTQQAAKCYDKGIPYSDSMIEEIADVLVMIKQFETVMSQPDRDLLEDQITYKLRRQLDRIEGEGVAIVEQEIARRGLHVEDNKGRFEL